MWHPNGEQQRAHAAGSRQQGVAAADGFACMAAAMHPSLGLPCGIYDLAAQSHPDTLDTDCCCSLQLLLFPGQPWIQLRHANRCLHMSLICCGTGASRLHALCLFVARMRPFPCTLYRMLLLLLRWAAPLAGLAAGGM
jgi:hypothetical protein